MTELTMAELQAQQQSVELALAAYENQVLPAALTVLTAQPMQDMLVQIQSLYDTAPEGMTKTQLGNVITVMTKVPEYLTQRATIVTAMLAPPEVVIENGVIEGEFQEVAPNPEPTPEPVPDTLTEPEPTPPE